jgi:hypothetical protein
MGSAIGKQVERDLAAIQKRLSSASAEGSG